MIQVGHCDAERRGVGPDVSDSVLHGPSVEKTGERVGVGLQLGLCHRPHHPEACSEADGDTFERGDIVLEVLDCCAPGVASCVEHCGRCAQHVDRHAHAGECVVESSLAQSWAG